MIKEKKEVWTLAVVAIVSALIGVRVGMFWHILTKEKADTIIENARNINASIDPTTNVITLIPNTDWYGTETVTIRVIDGRETIKRDVPKELPPGWKIVTNGKEFKWEDEDGYVSIFPQMSKEDTVTYAWDHYKFRQRRGSNTWVEVKDDKDN